MEGRYCAYLRKSRADEVQEKIDPGYDALEKHRSTLTELSSKMGAPIIRWYSDGIKSGEKIEDRGGMKALLNDVQSGEWDGVLVMEVERLTRGDLIDQGTVLRSFADTGTLIITPMKVYDPASEADMEYFEFGMFMSRREFKTINKRLVAGRIASVKQGQYIGQCTPYGFDKAKVGGMKTLVPNDEAPHVVMIFEMYAEGKSYSEIARTLDAVGAVPRRGKKWSTASVVNIVKNPVYIGKIRWNSTKQTPYYENGRRRYKTVLTDDPLIVDGLHEPLITQELWDAAKRRVSATPKRRGYQTRNHYGRILTCAECGKALHYCDSGNAKEPMLVHLHKGDGCRTKGCRIALVDEAMATLLTSIANQVEVSADSVDYSAIISECEAEAERCRKVIKDNLDRMERGVLTEEEYVDRKAELEARIAESEAKAAELRNESPDGSKRFVMGIRECLGAINDPDVPSETKRKLIWSIVDHIEYTNRATQGKNDIHLDVTFRSYGVNPSMPARFQIQVHTD